MKQYIFIVGLLLPAILPAQVITGSVTNQKNEPLPGASVYWSGTTRGVLTNDQGAFSLSPASSSDSLLVVSYAGYQPDTVIISDQRFILLVLRELSAMQGVTVTGRPDDIFISGRLPVKTEQITSAELRKAACCDLAGCFETQLTVQPQTTNVVTNSKELRILGLSGVYNQVLIDGLPMIQGLSYTYGISSIPGPLVENIYISKGANSVIQGYEGISGQINVETKKPGHTDKLLLNGYMNSFLEKHFNTNYSFSTGRKWKSLLAFHSVQPAARIDRDEDDFMDVPLLTRYLLHNRWRYGRENDWGWSASISVRFLHEQRIGGQTGFDPHHHKGSSSVYGQLVNINQPSLSLKTGYRFNDKHNIALHGSGFFQHQQSAFGTLLYGARQQSSYMNLQYEWNYGSHELRSGISFRYLRINEDISFNPDALARTYGGNYRRKENIPGIFAENTMRFAEGKLTWMAGLRADHHNQFGSILTPRTLVKYDLTPRTIIRANIGSGWRTVNLFSENVNLLASSRDVIFREALRPEKAWNTGISLTQKFGTDEGSWNGYFSFDYYHTQFKNQVFPDYDVNPTQVFIDNFSGKSISNGWQAELSMHLWKRLEVKTGYNRLDVYQYRGANKWILPFNPRDKVLSTVSYKTSTGRFQADMNIHWFGRQRLPDTKTNPEAYRRADYSSPYTTINAQVTFTIKKWELYTGCENISDFRQLQPIISWQDPFSPYFDISSVWGPTRGREFYLGIRFRLPQ